MLQSDDVMISNMRVRNFQIDPKSLRNFMLRKFIRTVMRLKKIQKRMMAISITDESSHSKFKV